uniref:hypothetical protein n=1 Tax=uncultured Algibacter sp. TaxID=298659 RepID=UPI0026111CC9
PVLLHLIFLRKILAHKTALILYINVVNNLTYTMNKRYILIILILTFSQSYGQYDWTPGKIILNSGKSLKGLVKIPLTSGSFIELKSTKIQFRKDEKSKKFKYDSKTVNRIYFSTFDKDIGFYEYVWVSKNKMALFKLIRNGKVKLYTRTIKFIENQFENKQFEQNEFNKPFSKNKYKKAKEYYIIKSGENIAIPIIKEKDIMLFKKENLRLFKKKALNYFADCKEVVSYIENDLYEDFDISQIVEDYNLLCE